MGAVQPLQHRNQAQPPLPVGLLQRLPFCVRHVAACAGSPLPASAPTAPPRHGIVKQFSKTDTSASCTMHTAPLMGMSAIIVERIGIVAAICWGLHRARVHLDSMGQGILASLHPRRPDSAHRSVDLNQYARIVPYHPKKQRSPIHYLLHVWMHCKQHCLEPCMQI